MRNFLCTILLFVSHALTAQSVDPILSFTSAYYRSDPFKSSFSLFIKHLTQDPDILDKAVRRKTDSTFFQFTGHYNKYSPFFFRPEQLNVSLEETPLPFSDSLPYRDTVFIYQLIARARKGAVDDVKKEFNRVHRQFGRRFAKTNTEDLTDEGKTIGMIRHYFVEGYGLAPITILWLEEDGSGSPSLRIILRITRVGNDADLPASFNHPE